MYLRQHFLIRIIPIIMKTAAIRKSMNRHETKHRNISPNSSNAAAKAHLQLFLLFLMPLPPSEILSCFILFRRKKCVTGIIFR